MSSLPPLFAYSFLVLFALLVGSLLNLIIYRLPIMLKNFYMEECRELLHLDLPEPIKKINLFFPRSFCPACKSMIPIWHNIPLISYLICRGRCFSCNSVIPRRYFFVELLSGILALAAGLYFGFTLTLLFALLFIWITLAIIFIDIEHQLIPDELSLSLLWLGLLANTYSLFSSLPDAVYGAISGYLSLWLFMQLYYLLTKKVGMGYGDFKLFATLGAWFGWTALPLILFLSSFIGALIGFAYLKITRQSKTTPIPFGPFLCMGGLTALFFKKMIFIVYTFL